MWAKCMWIAVGLLVGLVSTSSANERVSGAVGWYDRYVSEGIDTVPDSEFILSEITLDMGVLVFDVFWAQALSDSYNEVYFSVIHPFRVRALDLFVGVGRTEFPSGSDSGSWEVLGGAEWAIPNLATVYAETWYDFDVIEGGFLNVGLIREFGVPGTSDRLTLEPYAQLGLDYGFVSPPRRLKENNAQFGCTARYALNRNIALTNLDALGLGDETWGGAGIQLAF